MCCLHVRVRALALCCSIKFSKAKLVKTPLTHRQEPPHRVCIQNPSNNQPHTSREETLSASEDGALELLERCVMLYSTLELLAICHVIQ